MSNDEGSGEDRRQVDACRYSVAADTAATTAVQFMDRKRLTINEWKAFDCELESKRIRRQRSEESKTFKPLSPSSPRSRLI